jgi:hypothetical protein
MKAPIRLFVLFILFLGINQSWGQRLEARREWSKNGSSATWGMEAIAHLVYHNDSLFAMSYSPSANANPNGPAFRIDTYGYQVYSPNLDSLTEKRAGNSVAIPLGTDPIQRTLKIPYLNIRRSKLGLVTLISKSTIYRTNAGLVPMADLYFQYFRNGVPSEQFMLDSIPLSAAFGKKQLAVSGFLVGPNNNLFVTGIVNSDSVNSDIFIASYTAHGKFRWVKRYQRPLYQEFTHQEIDSKGFINTTVLEFDDTPGLNTKKILNYQIDTAGNLRKVVEFSIPYHLTYTTNFPKARRIENGGFALSTNDSIGSITDSNGHEIKRIINNIYDVWFSGNNIGYAYNDLWPLEDGGVVYVIPALAHKGYSLYTDIPKSDIISPRDSLVKIDGVTGSVLWKISISLSGVSGSRISNPSALTVTTSPDGNFYIGGTTNYPSSLLGNPQFIYKISNVGHIYDPIPQASPTATQPQLQERKARLSIYPNPAKRGEAFSYSIPADKVGGVLEIFSADGSKVYSQTISQSSGSVSMPSHLNAGLYLVRACGLEAKWIIE